MEISRVDLTEKRLGSWSLDRVAGDGEQVEKKEPKFLNIPFYEN